MRCRVFALLAVLSLIPVTAAVAQIGQTAALIGTVKDASGGVLPGVTVSITSPALIGGAKTAVTEGDGTFRFPAIAPGVYEVTFELSGFKPLKRDNVRVQLGETVSLPATLEVGTLQETVTVTGESPIVDVKSSAPQKNLTPEVLDNIPFSTRFGPDAMMMAPGVNPTNYTVYGSGGGQSNSYQMDGVDVSDPRSGTAWVFANYNWIQEVQVISLGANAEYGGYTGAASNSLFRSGGNQFHGLFETRYQADWMVSDNTTDEILKQNPSLKAGTTDYVTDTTIQAGGPIKMDKVWFFASFQYYRPKTTPAGYPPKNPTTGVAWSPSLGGPDARLEKSPRFLFKPTWQITKGDKLTGFLEMERYDVDGRLADALVSPEATLKETAPSIAWNGNYTKVLTSTMVFDVKYSGFWGYYYNDPYRPLDVAGWYDGDTGFYSRNSYYWYHADRRKDQANASLSKYASGFAGTHNLKFGMEYERSWAKTTNGYPGGGYIYAYSDVPYYQYLQDTYILEGINHRVTLFAQDSWTVRKNLTINAGLRWDHNTGFNPGLDETVFNTDGVAPRIGFAWDLTGNGKTVLRGHYGDFYDGAKTYYYQRVDPRQPPRYKVDVDPVTLQPISTPKINKVLANRTMDSNIKHPFIRQATIGLVRELFPGFSLSGTYIYRRTHNYIEDVLDPTSATFTTFTYTDPGPTYPAGSSPGNGNVLTVYNETSSIFNNKYIITNPSNAYRLYHGFEIEWTKRLANRWMLRGSWVISKTTGNISNSRNDGNSAEYNDPNINSTLQLNQNGVALRDGRLARDNTHVFKLLGTYQAPYGFNLSATAYYISGDTWTRVVRPRVSQGRQEMFIEPRGSNRLPGQSAIDLKVDKEFNVGGAKRLGLVFEVFSLMNDSTITSVTYRTPTSASGTPVGTPQGLVTPRRLFLSATYKF